MVQDGKLSDQEKSKIEDIIVELHRNASKALVDRDPNAMRELFSASFSTAGGVANFESLDEYVDDVKAGLLTYDAVDTVDARVRVVSSECAVLSGRRTVSGTQHGQPFKGSAPLKAVFIRERGRWRVLLWALTRSD